MNYQQTYITAASEWLSGGIHWITSQSLLTHYLSALTSLLHALVCQERVERPGHHVGATIVFSLDGAESVEERVEPEVVGPTSFPRRGRTTPRALFVPAPHTSSLRKRLSSQGPQNVIPSCVLVPDLALQRSWDDTIYAHNWWVI